MAEGLRRRRKELSAWQNACDAVAKNFPRGRRLATPSQGTFRAAEGLRRRRKGLSERNGVCDAVARNFPRGQKACDTVANSIKTLILL